MVRHYKVNIDSKVWTKTNDLEWPSKKRYVNVILGATEEIELCRKPLLTLFSDAMGAQIEVGKNHGIIIGESCEQLWVLMSRNRLNNFPMYPDSYQERAIAAHEGFHLVVQRNGRRKVRFDDTLDIKYLALNSVGKSRAEIESFLNAVRLLDKQTQMPAELVCKRLNASYKAMSKLQRDWLQVRIQAEWPAEFYMHELYYKNNEQAYYDFRRGIHQDSEDGNITYVLYTAGPLAVSIIEQKIARQEWQRRYVDGETMINLLFESLGCSTPDDRSPLVNLRFKQKKLTQ